MTGRSVLALMIAGFFVAAMLLIYNSYYRSTSTHDLDIPKTDGLHDAAG